MLEKVTFLEPAAWGDVGSFIVVEVCIFQILKVILATLNFEFKFYKIWFGWNMDVTQWKVSVRK